MELDTDRQNFNWKEWKRREARQPDVEMCSDTEVSDTSCLKKIFITKASTLG